MSCKIFCATLVAMVLGKALLNIFRLSMYHCQYLHPVKATDKYIFYNFNIMYLFDKKKLLDIKTKYRFS